MGGNAERYMIPPRNLRLGRPAAVQWKIRPSLSSSVILMYSKGRSFSRCRPARRAPFQAQSTEIVNNWMGPGGGICS